MFNGIDVSAYQGDIDYDKLKVDFVIISYALNANMARNEAKACLTAIAPYKIEYPVCFDFEYDSVTYAAKKGVKVTKQLASDVARAFLSEIEAAGSDGAEGSTNRCQAPPNGHHPNHVYFFAAGFMMIIPIERHR